MFKHTISIYCYLKVAIMALFCTMKTSKRKARTSLTTRKQNLKGFMGLFLGHLSLKFLNFKTIN